MKVDIRKTAKGVFGQMLANYIVDNDKTILNAAEKIGLHPRIISTHIRMRGRPRYDSIMLYSMYLMIAPSKLASMIDEDWREYHADS